MTSSQEGQDTAPIIDVAELPRNHIGTLDLAGRLFDHVSACVALQPEADDFGYVHIMLPIPAAEFRVSLGFPCDLRRFTACYRTDACWMQLATGPSTGQIPVETQFLLFEQEERYVMLIPLLDQGFRMVLQGKKDGTLTLLGESGDDAVRASAVTGVYVSVGTDPYAMIRKAAERISQRTGEVRLRRDKPSVGFIDYLGWCTYNAFYSDISHAKILTLLREYQAHGVLPGFVIIDEGWQPHTLDKRLTGIEAEPAKFPGGLGVLTDALHGLGVKNVLAWHAFSGYWRGLEPTTHPTWKSAARAPVWLPKRLVTPGEAVREVQATVGGNFYPLHVVNLPVFLPEPSFASFYDQYHRELAARGIAGVKIDAMAWVEMHGEGRGGRAASMRDLIRASEGSTQRHMNGNLLNCSSCSNDFILQSRDALVMRTSGDFDPKSPATHGRHLVHNAHVSFWTGHWVLPDWDMFQSGHPSGAYHAAARAISGGPIYTTDEPGQQSPALLRRLRLSDGRVPRCIDHAQVCRDGLFADPVREPVLLKIFNRNRCGGVLGLFHCQWPLEDLPVVAGTYRAADVEGLEGEMFAMWEETRQTLQVRRREDWCSLELSLLGYEVVTVVAVVEGFAPVGLRELLNPGGAILAWASRHGHAELELADGGILLSYSRNRPRRVLVRGMPADFAYTPADGRLEIPVPGAGQAKVVIDWEP